MRPLVSRDGLLDNFLGFICVELLYILISSFCPRYLHLYKRYLCDMNPTYLYALRCDAKHLEDGTVAY